jgi:hypothetical protein
MSPESKLCLAHSKQAVDLAEKVTTTFLGSDLGVICLAVGMVAEYLKREYPALWLIAEKEAKNLPRLPKEDPIGN